MQRKYNWADVSIKPQTVVKLKEDYRVNLDFTLNCKRCGCRYHYKIESVQPSKYHIDKFIEYYILKFKNNSYDFAHICDALPEQTIRVGKLEELQNFKDNIYINYGIPELLGFDVSVNKESGEG